MSKPFYQRLKEYYSKVAEVLRGDADAASIFPNTSDIGLSREKIYAEFLRLHAPSRCNVFLGGFLFDEDGNESDQMDVIITTDTTPSFNFHNPDGSGKSFSPVEGTLGIASIKSKLDKNQLFDALKGISTIPPTRPLDGRVNFTISIKNYEDWPLKILYATDGLKGETILKHLKAYFEKNPHIPIARRPNIIHVAGKYVIIRADRGMALISKSTGEKIKLEPGEFNLSKTQSDLSAILWTMNYLQQNASASSEILYSYDWIINKVLGID